MFVDITRYARDSVVLFSGQGNSSATLVNTTIGEDSLPTFPFVNNPDGVPYSARNSSRPDGYFVRTGAPVRPLRAARTRSGSKPLL